MQKTLFQPNLLDKPILSGLLLLENKSYYTLESVPSLWQLLFALITSVHGTVKSLQIDLYSPSPMGHMVVVAGVELLLAKQLHFIMQIQGKIVL